MRRNAVAVVVAAVLPLVAALAPVNALAQSARDALAPLGVGVLADTLPGRPSRADASPRRGPGELPAVIYGGAWPTSHVQGIAVDRRRGSVYWSFTEVLVRTDLAGRVLGTVTGITGHLGDLDLDRRDGRVYGSLEYRDAGAFYVAIFDGARIDRVGIDAQTGGVLTTVHLRDVTEDFAAGAGAAGLPAGVAPRRHRYGASGVDGISFGPPLGDPDGPDVLMVAYGVYPDTRRRDNDHQVLLAFDVRGWQRFARPLDQRRLHRSGPRTADDKVFVRTGNTAFGVQNLEYDRHTGRWLMAVYPGGKRAWPNYSLYAVDGATPPRRGVVRGQPAGETGRLATLAGGGLSDRRTGVRGWVSPGSRGLESLGDGSFYLVTGGWIVVDGQRRQDATATLHRWTGGTPMPFDRVSPAPAAARPPYPL
ncbi:hypothetical protein OOK41_23530 [Micromonospora sp. NBC_01655]|uniref:hypothetical protein n=1 Tax=Micromonospora sp. NBC_01655 TaxID=2975983 RepID=UPI0022564654|nr:hypothetical protein [Micromonospora sp. NBC_01655]MCX4473242.1 hypothetical protein [Micromonospora sp. NBC_01655]